MTFSLFEDSRVVDQSVRTMETGDSGVVTLDPIQVATDDQEPTETKTVLKTAVKSFTPPERVAAEYQRGLADAISAVKKMAELANQSMDYGTGFDPFYEVRRKIPCVNQLNSAMYNSILRGAKQTGLAAPGSYSLDGDFEQYLTGLNRHGGHGDEDKVRVDILGLCKAIFETYGGDAGDRAENLRIAKALISYFNLKELQIEAKSGIVELSSHMYLEKRYKGGYEFSYQRKDAVVQTLNNLAQVFHLSGMLLDMRAMRKALDDFQFQPEPNKTKFEGFIEDYPFTVKVFKSELRWKFPEQCVAILSDFVSEYGCTD